MVHSLKRLEHAYQGNRTGLRMMTGFLLCFGFGLVGLGLEDRFFCLWESDGSWKKIHLWVLQSLHPDVQFCL